MVVPYQRFQRFRADVKLKREEDDGVVDGRVFLHDLTPEGVGLFVDAQFRRDELVQIVIESPRPLYLKGHIAWCEESRTTAKVIREKEYRYRVGISLVFETDEDREVVRTYCDELAIRRDPKVVQIEAARQRVAGIIKSMMNFCLKLEDNLDKCIAMKPNKGELYVALAQTRNKYDNDEWRNRVAEATAILAEKLNYKLD